MPESYPDTFAAGMSAEDRERYLQLRAEQREHYRALRAAEEGLHELVRKYGLPFHPSDVAKPRPSPSPRFNNWWVKTPGQWQFEREARKRHNIWRTRARPATPAPLPADVDYIRVSQAARWSSVPEDWTCPCCGRGKVAVIRPTKQHDWVFGITSMRFADSAAPYGESSVTVCDACREAARGLNMEAGSDPEIGEWPSPYLGIDDLREII